MRITWIKLHAKIWSLKQPLKNISHWMPWWKHTVYYARYESELARKRYMNADPENRLVCSELKRLWNEKMNVLFKSEMEQKRHEKENMVWTPPFSMDELYQFPEKFTAQGAQPPAQLVEWESPPGAKPLRFRLKAV